MQAYEINDDSVLGNWLKKLYMKKSVKVSYL